MLEAPLHGVILRYGLIYGTGTGFDASVEGYVPLHVDGAARAAELAVSKGDPGIYNIAEADGTVSSDKAEQLLGWSADWRPRTRDTSGGVCGRCQRNDIPGE